MNDRLQPSDASSSRVDNTVVQQSGIVNVARDAKVRLSIVQQIAAAPPREALHQLPRDVSDFTDRQEHLQALRDILAGPDRPASTALPVAVITGMPGVGKRTLAVHLLHELKSQFQDADLVIDFTPTGGRARSSVDDMLVEQLQAQGVAPKQIPTTRQGREHLYRSWFEGKRAVVLIKNARCAAQVEPFLPADPNCAAIVTAQSTIRDLPGVSHHQIGPLSKDDAITLLAKVSSRPELPREAAAAAIARVCGYHPLALRIVAIRLGEAMSRGLSLPEVTQVPLDGGPLVNLFSENELREPFRIAYQALSAPAARVFDLLGVLRAPDVDASIVAALAHISKDRATAALSELASAGLAEAISPVNPAGQRYRMHELLQWFAEDKASKNWSRPDRRAALQRVFEHYIQQLSFEGVESAAQVQARKDWLEDQRGNLVAAVRQAFEERFYDLACRLARSSARFFQARGYLAAWHLTADWGLSAAQKLRDPQELRLAYENLGNAWLALGRPDAAKARYEQGLAVRLAEPSRIYQARVLASLGTAHRDLGQLDLAAACYASSLKLRQDPTISTDQLRGSAAIAWVREQLGTVESDRGHTTEALKHLHAFKEHCEALGYREDEVRVLGKLAVAYQRQGDAPQAAATYLAEGELHRDLGRLEPAATALEAAAALYRNLGNRVRHAHVGEQLGQIRKELGDYASAAQAFMHAGSTYGEVGQPMKAAFALHAASDCYRLNGQLKDAASALLASGRQYQAANRYEQATVVLGATRQLYHELGDRTHEAVTCAVLGRVHQNAQQPDQAVAPLHAAASLYRELGNHAEEASICRQLGQAHKELGRYLKAAAALKRAAIAHYDAQQPTEAVEALCLAGEHYRAGGQLQQAADAFAVSAGQYWLERAYRKAIEPLDACTKLYRELHDPANEAVAHERLGDTYAQLGQAADAADELYNAGELYARLEQPAKAADLLLASGRQYQAAHSYRQAIATLEASKQLGHHLGDRGREALALGELGAAHLSLDQPSTAVRSLKTARRLHKAMDNPAQEALVTEQLGRAYLKLHRGTGAAVAFAHTGVLYQRLEQPEKAARSFLASGQQYQAAGAHQHAIVMLEASKQIYHDLGNRPQEALILCDLGRMREALGHRQAAATDFRDGGELYAEIGMREQASAAYGQSIRVFQELGDNASVQRMQEKIADVTPPAQVKQPAPTVKVAPVQTPQPAPRIAIPMHW